MQFIKKETFLSVGGFDEHLIYGEDVDLILRISEKSRNVNLFHMPITVYCYRDNPYGRSNTRWRELKYQMERIYLKCSKRQNLPFYEYRFMGTFCINENFSVRSTQPIRWIPNTEIAHPNSNLNPK